MTENMTALAGEVDVVITHFPPTLEAVDRALYENDPGNPYFINDNEALLQQGRGEAVGVGTYTLTV